MTYIIVDTANTFFRARHVVRGTLEDKVGMSIATVLGSVRKAWRDFDGNHVIFCLEGRSWRKDVYAPYKRQRAEGRAAASPREQEEERAFWEKKYDERTKMANEALRQCKAMEMLYQAGQAQYVMYSYIIPINTVIGFCEFTD